MTFSGASLVDQMARLQGQAGGGSNLQSEARGLVVAAGEGPGYGNSLVENKKQQRVQKDPNWMNSGQGLGSCPLPSPNCMPPQPGMLHRWLESGLGLVSTEGCVRVISHWTTQVLRLQTKPELGSSCDSLSDSLGTTSKPTSSPSSPFSFKPPDPGTQLNPAAPQSSPYAHPLLPATSDCWAPQLPRSAL